MLKLKLIRGMGDYAFGRVCVMAAAVAKYRLDNGLPLGEATDELNCVCPTIRAFLIPFNDGLIWDSSNHRTEVLMPYVDKIIDTRNDELLIKRTMICVNWAACTLLPIGLKTKGIEELVGLQPIIDAESAKAVFDACDKLIKTGPLGDFGKEPIKHVASMTRRVAYKALLLFDNAWDHAHIVANATAAANDSVMAALWLARVLGNRVVIEHCCKTLDQLILESKPC